MRRFALLLLPAGLIAAAVWITSALSQSANQSPPVAPSPAGLLGSGGPLGDLTVLRPGRSARLSSAAPKRSSNWDNRRIPPGRTHVLGELQGPGTIRHIWLTFPEPAPGWLGREGNANHSELVLRIYWDEAKEPAVEAPVGDFFAAGFGQRRLSAGAHTLRLECRGSNGQSRGAKLGVDSVRLRQRWNTKREAPKD